MNEVGAHLANAERDRLSARKQLPFFVPLCYSNIVNNL